MIPLGILHGTFCFSKEAVRDIPIITSALFRLWSLPFHKWSLSSLPAMNHEKHSSINVFSRIDEKSLIIASALFRLWSPPCASRLDKWVYLDCLTNHHFPRVSWGTNYYIGLHRPVWPFKSSIFLPRLSCGGRVLSQQWVIFWWRKMIFWWKTQWSWRRSILLPTPLLPAPSLSLGSLAMFLALWCLPALIWRWFS